MNIDELFDYTGFAIDSEPHIVVDATRCLDCVSRPCTTGCPANCYNWSEEDQRLSFVYDGCLECGTCFVICEKHAFTRWRYPRGGYGVSYRMT